MGTRSAVGFTTATGFKGRYVHFDGYPSYMTHQLATIVRRDGAPHALHVLTAQHHGWSSIATGIVTPDYSTDLAVPGYGIALTDQPDTWHTDNDHDTFIDYAYAITEGTIEVWTWRSGWTRTPEHDIATSGPG